MSPTSAKYHPAPSSAKGDSNNARISIYKQLCKLMKASDGLHVETLNNKPDLTALTRSTADVLVSIDFHHSTLLTAGQQQFWRDYREMRSMNTRKPQVDSEGKEFPSGRLGLGAAGEANRKPHAKHRQM